MKQMETTTKIIGENSFHIRPFPAFVSANVCGELAKIATPLIAAITALPDDKNNLGDVDLEKAIPILSDAFSGLSGDQFEGIMKKLLVQYKNISVTGEATQGTTLTLDMDLANEIFCAELQDMIVLCFEVIKLNFSSFFKKLGVQFGKRISNTEEAQTSVVLESSI